MSSKISDGVPDPRIRRLVTPTRVVWSSDGCEHPESLLGGGGPPCTLAARAEGAEPASVLLDFGKELHGGVRLDLPARRPQRPARIRVRFGESVSEAMGQPDQDHAIHDFDTLAPWMGHLEIGNTAFRFVRIDLLDEETALTLQAVRAVMLFRDLDYLGSFECSDHRLNRIWQTGAYTVHLCMQDHVWDGPKRDRLVWIGDLYPELMVVATVFGKQDVVETSLDYARDTFPLPAWMNGISSYSLWWILCHHSWYRYHGDMDYLRRQQDYLLGLLHKLATECVDEDGREKLGGWRFLEWPTAKDPTAIAVGLGALLVMALRAGADLCRVLGRDYLAGLAEAAAARAATQRRPPIGTKQADALTVLAGMAGAEETNRLSLAVDPYHGLSTFYGYYVLQARSAGGDYQGCLDLIRTYWGGMLEMGATTFWEGFDIDWMEGSARIDELVPPGKRDIHADFGEHCYVGLRHSLCHGWAAGPTAWLTEHVLGLTPAEPGFAKINVWPNLGDLSYARGSIPTPRGVVHVRHERDASGDIITEIDTPSGVTVDRARATARAPHIFRATARAARA